MNKHILLPIALLCCLHQTIALKTHLDECHHTTSKAIADLEKLHTEGKVTYFELQATFRKLETVCNSYINSVDISQIDKTSATMNFIKPQAIKSLKSFQETVKVVLKNQETDGLYLKKELPSESYTKYISEISTFSKFVRIMASILSQKIDERKIEI